MAEEETPICPVAYSWLLRYSPLRSDATDFFKKKKRVLSPRRTLDVTLRPIYYELPSISFDVGLHTPSTLLFIVSGNIILSCGMHAWFTLTKPCHAYQNLVKLFPGQLPVGAGFSWNADWPWTHHRFLHRSDARRHRRSCARQRFGGWPQEAFQKAECIWKCVSQQVNTHTRAHTLMEISAMH